jgi:hypothetical protein
MLQPNFTLCSQQFDDAGRQVRIQADFSQILPVRFRRPTLYPIELLAQGKPTIRIRAPLLNANCRDFAPRPTAH